MIANKPSSKSSLNIFVCFQGNVTTSSINTPCSASGINAGSNLHNTGTASASSGNSSGGNHNMGPQPPAQESQSQPHAQQPTTIRHKVRQFRSLIVLHIFVYKVFNERKIRIYKIT